MPDDAIRPAPIAPYPAEAPPAGEPARRQKKVREPPATVLLPRDKLLRFGAAVLGQAELVAVLLGTGTKGRSVNLIAEDLVAQRLDDVAAGTRSPYDVAAEVLDKVRNGK